MLCLSSSSSGQDTVQSCITLNYSFHVLMRLPCVEFNSSQKCCLLVFVIFLLVVMVIREHTMTPEGGVDFLSRIHISQCYEENDGQQLCMQPAFKVLQCPSHLGPRTTVQTTSCTTGRVQEIGI